MKLTRYSVSTLLIFSVNGMFVVAACYALIYAQWSTLFIVAQGTVLNYAPFFLEKKYSLHTPREIHASISLFVFGSFILGEVQNFYNTIWWWDALLHFSAGYMLTVIALIMLSVVFTHKNITTTPFLMTLFAISFAIAASSLWEVYEFLIDPFTETVMQPSLTDTMWDIMLAGIASLLASFQGWNYFKKKTKPTALIEKIIRDGVQKNQMYS